jgi:predicted transcriptional regulator
MPEATTTRSVEDELLRMTAEVVAAYVRKNSVAASQIGEVIGSVYGSLRSLESKAETAAEAAKPSVPARKSITPDYLVCLEDGKKLKMLKRHLRSTYNLTPDAYREKWGLPPDYPMVAPNYAQARSAFAKKIGLGRVGGRSAAKRGGRRKSTDKKSTD